MDEHCEKLCYQVMDLMKDAMKWKALSAHAENEQEKVMEKEISENMYAHYKKAHEMLLKKYAE